MRDVIDRIEWRLLCGSAWHFAAFVAAVIVMTVVLGLAAGSALASSRGSISKMKQPAPTTTTQLSPLEETLIALGLADAPTKKTNGTTASPQSSKGSINKM